MSLRRAFPLLLLLAACAPFTAPIQGVTPPPSADQRGAGDPTRGAIISTAYVFGQPAAVAGNPAAAAEAVAQLEYLAVELAIGATWRDIDGLVAPAMAGGRDEARGALGLRPGVSAQSAIDSLSAAAGALRAGEGSRAEAALAPVSADPGVTLQRLAALPYLPRAASATNAAYRALFTRERTREAWMFRR